MGIKKVALESSVTLSFKTTTDFFDLLLERCEALGFLRNDKPQKSAYIRFAIEQEMDKKDTYKELVKEINRCKNENIHLKQQLARWQWIAEKERQKRLR